jgi:hypothetical protein
MYKALDAEAIICTIPHLPPFASRWLASISVVRGRVSLKL